MENIKSINIAVILAGGIGARYGSEIPKQFCKINGKAAVHYVLDEYIASNLFSKIIIAINDLRYKYLFKNYDKNIVKIVRGGENRTQTVYNALKYIKKYNPENVFFQDSVRPLIKKEDLSQYLEAINGFDCVVTYEPITDALYNDDRNKFKLIQSPDVVKFKKLYQEINPTNHTNAIYQQLKNPKLNFIKLNHANNKITYPYDLFILEYLIKYNKYIPRNSSFSGRNILLLGYSGGIGYEVYRNLLGRAIHIWIPSHKELNLSENFIDSLLPKYCNVDLIINCAGIPYKNEDSLLSHYEEMMNVNFRANVLLIEFAKRIRQIYHDRPINIVTISSSSATKGRAGFTIYSASKSALHSLIESQASELAEQEIYINGICPEKVDTPFWKKLHTPINKLEALTPQEVAKVILSYCDTKEYGKIIHIRKGLSYE
jgi:2-C-methyl-D-erythritol 4-phosphate cytidylyltransferase